MDFRDFRSRNTNILLTLTNIQNFMIRQNYKGDFSIIERFYAGEDKTPVEVPQHLRIDYFTRNPKGKYTVVRNGDVCTGCAVSDDGMSLTCYLALSRKCIGIGELLKVVTEIQDDGNFPDGKKFLPVPQTTDIMLVEGQSDGGKEISSEVMIEMRYGYSAYELAVLNGFKGTEEEWLQSLKQPAEDAAEVSAAATKKAIAAIEECKAATRAANEAAESGGSVATTGLLQLLLEHPDEPYTLTEEEVQSVFGGIENFRKAVAGPLALRDVFGVDGQSITFLLQPLYSTHVDMLVGFWVMDEQSISLGFKSNYITMMEENGAVSIAYVNDTGPDGGLFYELPGSIYSITEESTPEELEEILGDFAELKSAITGLGKKLIVSAGYHTTDNFGGATSRDYAPIVVKAQFFFGGNTNPTYSILFGTPDRDISIRLASSSGGYTSAKVDTLSTSSNSVVGAINELKVDIDAAEEKISGKQDKTDQSLKTTDKTVTGAINEINSKLPVYTTVPELTADYIIQVNPTNVEHIYYISIGDTVYNVTGADGIKWVDGIAPVAAANTTLVVSVINNMAVWGGF